MWEQNELEPIEPWSVCPLMTSMSGLLYFLGDDSKHLQSFDPINKIWKLLPKSKEVHLGGSLTVLDGKQYNLMQFVCIFLKSNTNWFTNVIIFRKSNNKRWVCV